MTITEFIRRYDIDIGIYKIKRYALVNVEFINKGRRDETWFGVESTLTKSGVEQLAALYERFCNKKHIAQDTVISVSVLFSADTEREMAENAWKYQCFSEIYQRERALEYKKKAGKTKYLYDENGNEYWYIEKDDRRHYTRDEG